MTDPTESRKWGRPSRQTPPKSSAGRVRVLCRRRMWEATDAIGCEAEALTGALVAPLARALPQADAGSDPARDSTRRAWE